MQANVPPEDQPRQNSRPLAERFSLYRLWAMIIKEFIQLGRDRLTFGMMVGIPIMAAIGAPSSLAVELAEAHNLTLVGFLREGGFNIYTGGERIELIN